MATRPSERSGRPDNANHAFTGVKTDVAISLGKGRQFPASSPQVFYRGRRKRKLPLPDSRLFGIIAAFLSPIVNLQR